MNDTTSLLHDRQEIVKGSFANKGKVIRGTLVLMKRVCGNKRCRCARGQKHQSWYISQSHKGATRMIYIPRKNEAGVRECIQNYQDIKKSLDKISKINLKLLLKRAL